VLQVFLAEHVGLPARSRIPPGLLGSSEDEVEVKPAYMRFISFVIRTGANLGIKGPG
jgi:hypothetical protein